VGACIAAAVAACASASNDGLTNDDAGVPAQPSKAGGAAPGASSSDAPSSADASDAGSDPFAPQPDTSEGLVNVSADLDAVLEHGALAGACDAWRAAPSDRRAMLLCGKSMFFDEGYGTAGVPTSFVTLLTQSFTSVVGTGFSKLGMIPDPRSPQSTQGLPLGMAPGAKLGTADTLAFTCASCHFGRLPDGRYAVGAPNLDYQYGAHNLDLAVFPTVALSGDTSKHDPEAIAIIQPLLDAVNANPALKANVLAALLPVVGAAGSAPAFPATAEHLYATWKPGTMDFFIEPLPFNDHVHTISKISALWGIPSDAEVASSGMAGGLLSWTGATHTLLHFMEGFVTLGGGQIKDWADDKLAPVQAYVESLRAPANPTPPPPADVARGQTVYGAACIACHDGPRGSGKRVFTFDEIGTDAQLKLWVDPQQTGQPCCSITFEPGDAVTHGVKAPRLVGTWAMKRFLHNGSVDSLDDVLCAHGSRGDVTEPAYGNGGHTFGCELADDDKRALLAYLRTR
jgi:hypothetical protein